MGWRSSNASTSSLRRLFHGLRLSNTRAPTPLSCQQHVYCGFVVGRARLAAAKPQENASGLLTDSRPVPAVTDPPLIAAILHVLLLSLAAAVQSTIDGPSRMCSVHPALSGLIRCRRMPRLRIVLDNQPMSRSPVSNHLLPWRCSPISLSRG